MYKKITISVLLIQLLSQITIKAMQEALIKPAKPSPIHLAAADGNLTTCMALLVAGADANAPRERGRINAPTRSCSHG